MSGIVYILSNPAMEGLVKIGRTAREDVGVRLKELFGTGVPFPFECEYAVSTDEADEVEAALHKAFQPNRVNPSREFFEIEPHQAIAILKLLDGENVTPAIDEEADKVDESGSEFGERFSSGRRPNFNLHEMGIQNGEELRCIKTGETAVVVDTNRVEFRGETLSLTEATRRTLDIESGTRGISPRRHWQYKGASLKELYEETYV